MHKQVLFTDLGINQPYKAIWDYQEKLLQQNVHIKSVARGYCTPPVETQVLSAGSQIGSANTSALFTTPVEYTRPTNYLLFVEHAPVYTLGKSGDIGNVLISEEEQQRRHIEFYKTNRGGDITFHGPQQLVGYPILDLEQFKTDLGWYLRSLEEVIILTLKHYGLKGDRSKGETGVWLDPDVPGKERKICAMGIRCSRWITMHGFAFNVNTNLEYFNYIVPCGIVNKQVTSLQKELGYKVEMDEVCSIVKRNFEMVFDVQLT